MKISEFFSKNELACKCCGELHANVSHYLIPALERIRELAKKPIIVTSGYRCLRRNTAIGGAKRSTHMSGLGADIKAKGMTAEELYKLIDSDPKLRMGGLKLYPSWVHFDLGNYRRW